MLSTMQSQPKIKSTLDQKPSITLFYNKTKVDVDTLDKMVRSYFTKRVARKWPLVLFYNTVDICAINAFVIWQGLNYENGSMRMKQRRKFLVSLEKELCGITEEEHLVAPIFATRNGNVNLAENDASLNKRVRYTLCDRKKDQKCQSLCSRYGKHISCNLEKSNKPIDRKFEKTRKMCVVSKLSY